MVLLKGFFHDQEGAAAVQYAVVAGILTLVVLAGCLALRVPLIDLYDLILSQAGDALTGQSAAASSEKG